MMSRCLLLAALASLPCAAPVAGQVDAVCGPTPAPLGCSICATISNDTASPVIAPSPCPFVIKDTSGQIIYTGANFCGSQAPFTISPGNSLTMVWPQLDENTGLSVPAGFYTFEVTMPSPLAPIPFQVTISTAVQAAVGPLGVPRIGNQRHIMFCAPNDPGKSFVMVASTPFSPGIQVCPFIFVPVTFDDLLLLSLDPNNPYFLDFQGTLGPDGVNLLPDPSLNIPNAPSLIGTTILVAGVVMEPSSLCPVGSISPAYSITIL